MKCNVLLARTSQTIAAIALAATIFAGVSFAQNINVNAVPKYTVLHPEQPVDVAEMQRLAEAGAALPTWTGSFTYKGTKYPYTMIGTDPSKGSATTTLNMVIIPLIVKVPGQTFDPTKPIQKACGTGTAEGLTLASPIFSNKVNYTVGGTNLGTTQYEDAVQRGEFWSSVKSKSPNYHVILKYKVAATQTLSDSSGQLNKGSCGNFAGVDINLFDGEVQSIIAKLGIKANEFPYIMTYDVFETEGGQCCVLGYHSVTNGGIAYGTGSYGDVPFQCNGCGTHGFTDVVTISHEIGETINDPYTNNGVPQWKSAYAPQYGCSGALEVGDPLAGDPVAVKVPGNTHQYYVQDLAFEPWFALVANGKSTSVNHWYSMFNTYLKTISTNEHSQCAD
jgi:hypothetical protein